MNRTFCSLLFFTGFAVAGGSTFAESRAVGSAIGNQETYERLASEQAACGPNALFVFLQLRGIAVPYAQVSSKVPRNATGTSLASLSEASRRVGYNVAALRVNWDDENIHNLEYPLIAHQLHPGREDGGHYVVLLSCNGERVTYIDGTSGLYAEEDWKWMRARLSGYCLVAPSTALTDLQYRCLVLVLGMVGVTVAFLTVAGRSRTAGAAVLATVVGIASESCHGNDVMGAPPAHGTRVVTLLLHAYGRPSIAIATSLGECSLSDIQRHVNAAGVPLTLSRLTPADLALLPTPFLTTLEVSSSGRQALCLVHYIDDDFIDMIDDATVTHRRVERSVFIRDWSGYAAYVSPQPPNSFISWPLMAGIAFGAVVLPRCPIGCCKKWDRQ